MKRKSKISWEPGRDSLGNVPKGEDGIPIYVRSKCGRYTISRAMTNAGWICDAWLVVEGALPVALASGVSSEEANKAVEDHADALVSKAGD